MTTTTATGDSRTPWQEPGEPGDRRSHAGLPSIFRTGREGSRPVLSKRRKPAWLAGSPGSPGSYGGVRELATDYRVTVDSTTRKLLTPEELHDRFGGPTGPQLRLILSHVRKLGEARDDADYFRQLVEAFKLTTFADPTGRVVQVMVPGPVEHGPKTLSEAQRAWVISSVTAYWNDVGQYEKRPTASSYARWRAKYNRRGQPNPYIGRAALDSYVSGQLDRHTQGKPTEYDPDQDWRETITTGTRKGKLERPLDAALRVAGLV